MFKARSLLGPLAVAVVLGGGCSKALPPPESATAKNVRLVTTAYLRFADKNHRSPKDASELKPILQEMDCDPVETFRSERDQEPLVIVWDAQDLPAVAARKGKSPMLKSCVLVYEQRGEAGRRFVGYSNAFVKEMAEADLARAHFPANHKFR